LKRPFYKAILAIMKKASITPEVKNNLSALIDSIKGGSPVVLIVDRGRPVARLEPVSALRPDDDSRLVRCARASYDPRVVAPRKPCSRRSRRG
jgi:antitoxin (DNA-binding transcriptional repressor) of toxin-antitoxin stability system